MITRLGLRMLRETDMRLLTKFAYTFGWKGMRAVQKFKQRSAKGDMFPAFMFISITNACNLNCQGCWVTPSEPPQHLSPDFINKLISAGKKRGSYFYGLLGGEPFLHPQLFEIIAANPDCYFQILTNGTLITPEIAARLRRLGNVTPLISLEGSPSVSDIRRGGTDVHARTLAGLRNCRDARLITGVACSICRSNLDDLATESFVQELIALNVHYLWYYIYRPVGPRPAPELALKHVDILRLRQFMVDLRTRAPIAVIDAYWDQDGHALCPAAVGIGYHVNPFGALEPCPIVQFAADKLDTAADIDLAISESAFLDGFRNLVRQRTRGCILMENPAELADFLEKHNASDCTGRGKGLAELRNARCYPCHHQPGEEIPERHWAYRFAKKNWFFGFGAYG